MKPYYSADGIELYHGDNLEVLAALGLDPADVALLWGDPPYGGGLGTDTGVAARKFRAGNTQPYAPMAHGDDDFMPAAWQQYRSIVLWGANHYANRLSNSASWFIWDKREMTPSNFMADCEMAWTNLPGTARVFRHYWNGPVRASERGFHVHPTQKPVALAAWGFRQAKLKPGDLVLSPWLGSGPEAVAAREMGLRFIGIELERAYLDACVDRLRQAPLPLVAKVSEPEQGGLDLGTG